MSMRSPFVMSSRTCVETMTIGKDRKTSESLPVKAFDRGDGSAGSARLKSSVSTFGFLRGTAGLGQSGVNERGGHSAGCVCSARIVVHPRRDGGAIIEQHELSPELLRVTRPGVPGEVDEQRPQPGTVGFRYFLRAGAFRRLGIGTRERAPTKPWLAKHETLYVEYPEQPLPRRRVTREPSRHTPANAFVASHEIGAYEPLLVAEQRVQRRLGHASALDDPVDADRMYAFLIEEMARGVEQSLPR